MAQRKRAMSFSVFDRKYKALDHDGSMTRHFEDITAEPSFVWSVVEGDGDALYLLPGYHVVNVLGYVQTENPWTAEDDESGLTVKY